MTHEQRMAEAVAVELGAMVERLYELEDYCADQGYRAGEHKIQEARGPLASAQLAMEQYATGELTPR